MVTEPGVRRCILVPIDPLGMHPVVLETVVRIARQLDRKLLGLLLEDIRLLKIADLPFTTEISLHNGQERSLLRDHLSQQQSVISAELRRQLADLAASNRVELSFENAAGGHWTTMMERDGKQDIFLPARKRWHAKAPDHRTRRNIVRRLGMVLANDPTDNRIINTAASLSKANLVGDIYILSKQPPLQEALRDLYRPGHPLKLQANFSCSAEALVKLIKHSPYDLLLLPGQCLQDIPDAELEAALDKTSGQVLVIN
jgi:hypothetical protein